MFNGPQRVIIIKMTVFLFIAKADLYALFGDLYDGAFQNLPVQHRIVFIISWICNADLSFAEIYNIMIRFAPGKNNGPLISRIIDIQDGEIEEHIQR
jgi:hypothetical protein